MDQANKAVVNLEVSAGFFRIATDQTIYNITVLGNSGRAERVSEKTVPTTTRETTGAVDESELLTFDPLNTISETAGDSGDYYKQVSQDLFSDIGKLAKQLSHTLMDIPAEDRLTKRVELDEAGERIEEAKKQLKDIVAMTEHATMEIMDRVDRVQAGTSDLKDLLSFLRDHHAFRLVTNPESEDAEGEDAENRAQVFEDLRAGLVQAGEFAATMNAVVEQGAGSAAVPQQARYLFILDPVLQTMYELCTNETVKKHISSARATAAQMFDLDAFIDLLSPRVSKLPVEDGFFTVPMADVLYSLYEACSDKAIKNLLKNMEAKMSLIFLDQNLPLEVPVIEEAAVAVPPPLSLPSVDLGGMLNEAISLVDKLAAGDGDKSAGSGRMSGMTLEDQHEIFAKIENAFQSVSNISSDVFRITESLSFQDLSGQQIMKIIKLLSDFQIQLLAMVVSFGSQLKNKEKNIHITAEESKKLAQNDVDTYINKIMGGTTENGTALLDQQAVNSMLEEFGF
ncbi:MAG: hypothetical protein A2511_06315 [Deltaproteobacteria bacterium RIFOXYD12_FULL_50_9]|nr:MAG: hypothetical protein A2511_06315 [Deltaproteobacteria bacterium RIFOXYD12_FULL_50_9]